MKAKSETRLNGGDYSTDSHPRAADRDARVYNPVQKLCTREYRRTTKPVLLCDVKIQNYACSLNLFLMLHQGAKVYGVEFLNSLS